MFSNFNLYIILGLVIAIGAILGYHFYTLHSYDSKILDLTKANNQLTVNNATLQTNNDTLTSAVQNNEKTIAAQQVQTQKLLDTQKTLSDANAAAEAENFDRVSKIKDQDLVQSSIANPEETEKEINDDYSKSIDSLISATTIIGNVK